MEVAIGGKTAALYYCVDEANIKQDFWYCNPDFVDFTYIKPLKELLKPATVKDFGRNNQ
ncbi:MAG: hypothetical protein JNK20_11370 [Flavipsychrobacter sp.]|jgi:hypothetical protein|nr:hypothetical protein [Flavipsychrobacter sp.]